MLASWALRSSPSAISPRWSQVPSSSSSIRWTRDRSGVHRSARSFRRIRAGRRARALAQPPAPGLHDPAVGQLWRQPGASQRPRTRAHGAVTDAERRGGELELLQLEVPGPRRGAATRTQRRVPGRPRHHPPGSPRRAGAAGFPGRAPGDGRRGRGGDGRRRIRPLFRPHLRPGDARPGGRGRGARDRRRPSWRAVCRPHAQRGRRPLRCAR